MLCNTVRNTRLRDCMRQSAEGGVLLMQSFFTDSVSGTKDGSGAGDHDVPYAFGNCPTVASPLPFSRWQLAHLLILRGRAQDGDFDGDSLGSTASHRLHPMPGDALQHLR